jgi:hypothetical protein
LTKPKLADYYYTYRKVNELCIFKASFIQRRTGVVRYQRWPTETSEERIQERKLNGRHIFVEKQAK